MLSLSTVPQASGTSPGSGVSTTDGGFGGGWAVLAAAMPPPIAAAAETAAAVAMSLPLRFMVSSFPYFQPI
ncbi:hypothetical protein MPY17_40525 (plasmid) [Rhodococcus opacus]|uniref:hypothetical protein n=1 Tax=Rhodococcus opacus TaxID=37919 RepID=UPI0021589128|nr:hypothetical protein [Rhodococcus opacus]UUK33961.1 hypothetical protein MPY17_40525 [Rhodococcus opacus]